MIKIIFLIILMSTTAANAALTVNNVPRVKTGGSTPTLQNSSITDNGNVGVNSTSPSQTLDVNGTIKATTIVAGSGSGTITGDANGNIGIGTSQPLSFFDVNSKFNVTSGGNVGVGITQPTSLFDVNGKLKVESGGNVGIGTSQPLTLFDVNSKLNVMSNGNVGVGTIAPVSKFQIVGSGNVGINSTNPGVTLDVGGSIRASGDVTAVNIKATSGTPYVCIDTNGKLVKSASACSGT